MEKRSSKLPPFLIDKGDKDQGYETIMDFYLSWTLKCSMVKYKKDNEEIYDFSRHLIYLLIHGNNNINKEFIAPPKTDNKFYVRDVKIKRQFKRIDIVAEIKVNENNFEKEYILNIENKYNTNIGPLQLKSSKKEIRKKYKNHYNIIDIVIFFDETGLSKRENIDNCINNGYKFLSINDLIPKKGPTKTGNTLFDEFWYYFKNE